MVALKRIKEQLLERRSDAACLQHSGHSAMLRGVLQNIHEAADQALEHVDKQEEAMESMIDKQPDVAT
eukprot:6914231-Karenia_brevis.AAC.1